MEILDLRLLYTFLIVAQTGSFKAAAVRLDATQPAVSNRISRLERALGVRLLERTTRSCHLTARGRSLVDYAQRMFALSTELRSNVAETDAIGGLIKIGVVETIALTWLPELLKEVARRLPRLQLQIDVDLSTNLIRKLQTRELDLACVVAPATMPGIASEPLNVMQMAWVARPDLPLPAGPLTPDAMSDQTILVHTGSRHMSAIEAWLRRSKRSPRRVTACNSLPAIIKLTLGGAGLSLVPISAVAGELAAGRLRIVASNEAMPTNPFVVAYPEPNVDIATRAIVAATKDVAARVAAGKHTRHLQPRPRGSLRRGKRPRNRGMFRADLR